MKETQLRDPSVQSKIMITFIHAAVANIFQSKYIYYIMNFSASSLGRFVLKYLPYCTSWKKLSNFAAALFCDMFYFE